MAYARINTITFTSEEAADELQAIYASTAPAGFPEALLLVSVRTGPLTASLTSIYEDKAAFDRSAEERTMKWSCFLGQVCGTAKMHLVYVHAAFRISAWVKYAVSDVRLSRAV